MTEADGEEITLKWGTLKGWNPKSDAAKVLLKRYFDIGSSMSCMAQQDTDEQKQILVDLANLSGMKIYLDWDGKYVSKDEAIEYIQNYGTKKEKVA